MCRVPLLLLVLLCVPVSADQVLRSPVNQVNLIELYTSEGCSSCPPADRWLSGLKTSPGLWKQVVPVAFHVDYWNYLGWKDRFSRHEFSERQRNYAREGGVRVVYTPGVMSNGKEWRNFSWQEPQFDGGNKAGVLEASVHQGELRVVFKPHAPLLERQLRLSLALLGTGMETDVRAGENRGRALTHDFAVLEFRQVKLKRDEDRYEVVTTVPTSKTEARRYALALWVSKKDTQAPIQATGGWLKD